MTIDIVIQEVITVVLDPNEFMGGDLKDYSKSS